MSGSRSAAGPQVITVAQAALLLQLDAARVRRFVATGSLRPVGSSGVLLLDRRQVSRLARTLHERRPVPDTLAV